MTVLLKTEDRDPAHMRAEGNTGRPQAEDEPLLSGCTGPRATSRQCVAVRFTCPPKNDSLRLVTGNKTSTRKAHVCMHTRTLHETEAGKEK